MRQNLLISFSGGETSAYMTWWLWTHKKEEYNMTVVFANTGEENEETLRFVNLFEVHFGIPVVWVESKINPINKLPTTYFITNYFDACRDWRLFHDMVKKYGIPNQTHPHCTRELKQNPIISYAKSIFGKNNCFTAIGIRVDEIDRMNKNRKKLKLIYPLIEMIEMTKPKINFWWSQQKFRLELKGYQGNCMTCWKKSDHKLFTIAKEDERKFTTFNRLENAYGRFTPESRIKKMESRGELPQSNYPLVFFRKNRSAIQIIDEAKNWDGTVTDDSVLYDLDNGQCEVFSDKCGDN